jgi:hypothetical protein
VCRERERASKHEGFVAEALRCYRCGQSLTALTLPLRRLEECPSCRVHLHVCRMCTHFAPRLPTGCDEQDAIEVRDKASANFCDYFKPSATAFDGAHGAADKRARTELDALFGKSSSGNAEPAAPSAADTALAKARDLFK